MIRLFGLCLQNLSMPDAVGRLARAMAASEPSTVFFVNTHAARLATDRPGYRRTLARADLLLVDGMGIRIAAGLRGHRLRANLVGTDLVPALLRAGGTHERSCFLFGGTEAINARAAAHLARIAPDWRIAGRQHGYLEADAHAALVETINASGATLLLVGLGNPLQEQWLDRHADRLRTPLRLAVGGLFHHWAGDLDRAPAWVRRAGFEWLQLCVQQPRRTARYAVDIPLFLVRALLATPADRGWTRQYVSV